MADFKDPTRTPGTYRKLRLLSRICSLAIIMVGFLVLIGFVFDITVLKSVRSSTVPMNPIVAFGFVAAGLGLLFKQEDHWGKYNKKGNLLAYFILLIGVMKLFSVITGIEIPVDLMLFKEQL